MGIAVETQLSKCRMHEEPTSPSTSYGGAGHAYSFVGPRLSMIDACMWKGACIMNCDPIQLLGGSSTALLVVIGMRPVHASWF